MPTLSAHAARAPYAEEIARALRREIVKGERAGGSWLREREIAERFGTSRGPVRQALALLEGEGLVELHPHRGAQVRLLTLREISDLFEIRAAIGGLVARLVSRRASDDEIAAIRTEIDGLIAAGAAGAPIGRLLALGTAISVRLLAACESPDAQALAATLEPKIEWHARYTWLGLVHCPRSALPFPAWAELGAALGERDGEAAAAAAQRITRTLQDVVLRTLAEDGPR